MNNTSDSNKNGRIGTSVNMSEDPGRVAYVVKVYPRFSQTFILNEILAHQHVQAAVDIISLRRPDDGRFHASIAEVTSTVHYVDRTSPDAERFWQLVQVASQEFPRLLRILQADVTTTAEVVQHAILVARLVRSRGIRHLHAHFANVATDVARLAAAITGITFSFTAHARDIFHENVDLSKLKRNALEASFIVTVSSYNLDYLRSTLGEQGDKVRLVYNGLDLQRFVPQPSLPSRDRNLVAVGRLIPKKGFGDLISACGILKQQGVPFHCNIIGEGPLGPELQRQIDDLGMQDEVALLGPLPIEEVARRIQEGRVFVAPCVVASDGDRDGLPTVLLEAMALGTPCVSTDVTGIPEILQHRLTGLMVSQADPHQLALACRELLDNIDLGNHLAATARTQIEQQFDIRNNAAQLRRWFQQAIHRPQTTTPGQHFTTDVPQTSRGAV